MDTEKQQTENLKPEVVEQENEETLKIVEPTLEEQLTAMKDQWLRSVAECENVRRRFEKEKEDALKYAATQFARDMIGITDFLEKALENVADRDSLSESVKAFIEGVEMTQKEMHNAFSRHGVKKVDPENKTFDPNVHQAMIEVENPDVEPGKIVDIMQHGYTMHGRLLRPSMVSVSKK
ncbi:MAG: nucleotide exchange factor GrpE [Alphaproteobacteria bacterium CG_4_10_14_0_8_um_filter_37_21]|nr:MAG: nucleotide exchange factor GrpE [Alphaproteobacteria bacterium CG_4_10_14_0_8_um_filter_37_21]